MPADRLDPWNLSGLQALLAPLDHQAQVVHVSDIDSTNTELMRRARAGDTRSCLLLADAQSAGRGRLGRQWHSRPGDALLMSLGVTLAPQHWSGLSLAVGCCLADALDPTLDKGIGLKWPNDLMLTPWDKPLYGHRHRPEPCHAARRRLPHRTGWFARAAGSANHCA